MQNIRAILYYRVSTKLQEEKYSLPFQKRELKKLAEQKNWKVVAEFTDVDSGGKLDKKGLTTVMDYADDRKMDIVAVVDQDRLSRLDPINWEYLKSVLRENNVKIADLYRITDLADENDEFVADLNNLLARREKRTIVKRMMRGKKQRFIDGKYWGQVPFEYEYDKNTGTSSVKEGWAWTIPTIDDMYLNKEMGMNLIAQELNKISKTPTGNFWNEHLIWTRLTSKAFHGVGEMKFNTNGKKELVSVDGMFEPMRTLETYNQIQETLEKRRSQFRVTSRQKQDIHPFRRTSFSCGLCGRKITLAQHGSTKKEAYYLKHGRKLRVSDRSVCDISINTVRILPNTLKIIKQLLNGDDIAKKYLNLENDDESVEKLKANIKLAKNEANSAKSAVDKLLDLYLSNNLTKEKYINKEKELRGKIDLFEKQLKENELKLVLINKNQLNHDIIYEYLGVVGSLENDLTALEIANLVGQLFPNGTLYENKLVMHSKIRGIPFDVEIPIAPNPYNANQGVTDYYHSHVNPHNIGINTYRSRVHNYGLSPEEALKRPLGTTIKQRKKKPDSIRAFWENHENPYNISYAAYRSRLYQQKLSREEAMSRPINKGINNKE